MSVKILTEHHFEFLSLKGGCTGSSEPKLVKMPHCWKSRVTAQFMQEITQEKNAFHAIVASMKTCIICKCMYVSEVLPVFVVSLERQTENFLRSAEENNNKHK